MGGGRISQNEGISGLIKANFLTLNPAPDRTILSGNRRKAMIGQGLVGGDKGNTVGE